MTENNKKAVETLGLLGFKSVYKITDDMLDVDWYDISNSIKYIRLIENKFKIKFAEEHFIELLLSEIANTNPLYWQTVYKVMLDKTYEDFGIEYNDYLREGLEGEFKGYTGSKESLRNIKIEARRALTCIKDNICLAATMSPSLRITDLFVHKGKYYISGPERIQYWDDKRNKAGYKETGCYSIKYIDYYTYTGEMNGKKLRPITVYDEAVDVVKNERYSLMTHQNYVHVSYTNYNKHDFLLKGCELLLKD